MSREEEIIAKTASDPRSNDELIEALRTDPDNEEYNAILTILQSRRDPELIGTAQEMCRNNDPITRTIGAQILGQNGAGSYKIMLKECIESLLDRVLHDEDPEVLANAAIALDDYDDPRIAPSLAKLKNHSNEDVRYGVVLGLLTRSDQAAVEALIELSGDSDTDVRNWATFGLARQIDEDTPEIREALYRRLQDEDNEIRGEALVGLAKRDDERVIEPLIKELEVIYEADEYCDLAFEAAMETGDSRLYPGLIVLKEDEEIENDWLDRAIAACRLPEPGETEDQPDDKLTTCAVCGLKNAFNEPDNTGFYPDFCPRCGWDANLEQQNDPDIINIWNRRSLNQERERWKKRIEMAIINRA